MLYGSTTDQFETSSSSRVLGEMAPMNALPAPGAEPPSAGAGQTTTSAVAPATVPTLPTPIETEVDVHRTPSSAGRVVDADAQADRRSPSSESGALNGAIERADPAEPQLEPCPVSSDELIDGLFGALTWFARAYATICQRSDMELLTPQGYILLRMIARYAEQMRAAGPTRLASALGTSKGYVADLSRLLVIEGLVVKRRSRGDGRVNSLDLTAYGAQMASTDKLALYLWEVLNAEFGPDGAHELALVLPLMRRQPVL